MAGLKQLLDLISAAERPPPAGDALRDYRRNPIAGPPAQAPGPGPAAVPTSGFDPRMQGPPQKNIFDIRSAADPLGTKQAMDKYLGPNILSALEKMIYMRYALTTPWRTALGIGAKEIPKGQVRGMLKDEMKKWDKYMEGEGYEGYTDPKILKPLAKRSKGGLAPDRRGPPMSHEAQALRQLLDLRGGG